MVTDWRASATTMCSITARTHQLVSEPLRFSAAVCSSDLNINHYHQVPRVFDSASDLPFHHLKESEQNSVLQRQVRLKDFRFDRLSSCNQEEEMVQQQEFRSQRDDHHQQKRIDAEQEKRYAPLSPQQQDQHHHQQVQRNRDRRQYSSDPQVHHHQHHQRSDLDQYGYGYRPEQHSELQLHRQQQPIHHRFSAAIPYSDLDINHRHGYNDRQHDFRSGNQLQYFQSSNRASNFNSLEWNPPDLHVEAGRSEAARSSMASLKTSVQQARLPSVDESIRFGNHPRTQDFSRPSFHHQAQVVKILDPNHHHLQGLQWQHPSDLRQVNLHHPIFPQDLIQDSRSENHLRNQDPHQFHHFQRQDFHQSFRSEDLIDRPCLKQKESLNLQGIEKKMKTIMEIIRSLKIDIVQLKEEMMSSPSEAIAEEIAKTQELEANEASLLKFENLSVHLSDPQPFQPQGQQSQDQRQFPLTYQYQQFQNPTEIPQILRDPSRRDDLKAFLGDNSTNFVAWLRDYLAKENHIARAPLDSILKAEASRNNEEGSNKEWKSLPRPRPPPQPPPKPPWLATESSTCCGIKKIMAFIYGFQKKGLKFQRSYIEHLADTLRIEEEKHSAAFLQTVDRHSGFQRGGRRHAAHRSEGGTDRRLRPKGVTSPLHHQALAVVSPSIVALPPRRRSGCGCVDERKKGSCECGNGKKNGRFLAFDRETRSISSEDGIDGGTSAVAPNIPMKSQEK